MRKHVLTVLAFALDGVASYAFGLGFFVAATVILAVISAWLYRAELRQAVSMVRTSSIFRWQLGGGLGLVALFIGAAIVVQPNPQFVSMFFPEERPALDRPHFTTEWATIEDGESGGKNISILARNNTVPAGDITVRLTTIDGALNPDEGPLDQFVEHTANIVGSGGSLIHKWTGLDTTQKTDNVFVVYEMSYIRAWTEKRFSQSSFFVLKRIPETGAYESRLSWADLQEKSAIKRYMEKRGIVPLWKIIPSR